jgi:hypothetical protein
VVAALRGRATRARPEVRIWLRGHAPALFGAEAGSGGGGISQGYFISGRGKKAAITETVRSRVVPRLVVYVSPKLTRQTFCTMRNLRRARRLFMYRAGVAERPSWPERELLEVCVVLDRLPPAFAARAP